MEGGPRWLVARLRTSGTPNERMLVEFYQGEHTLRLSSAHRRMLYAESGISPDVALERGYYTARNRSDVPEAFAGYQRRLGLVVPMYSPDGSTIGYQLRPDRGVLGSTQPLATPKHQQSTPS